MDELENEAERATEMLKRLRVEKVFRHNSSELVIQFSGGVRLFVDAKASHLELSITGTKE
jgi:hypothetical protein